MNHLKRALWTLAASLCWVSPSHADEPAEEPLPDKSAYTLFRPTPEKYLRDFSADRPDRTDTPITVDAGHIQVEMDLANLTYNRPNSDRGNVHSMAFAIAPMNVKAGLLNALDFQLVLTPYAWEKTDNHDTGLVERRSGFEGLTPRLKWNVIGNDGGFFALALLPFVSLPVSQNGLGSPFVEGGLGLPFSFDIPGWEVGAQTTVNVVRNDSGTGYHPEFDNSISVGHEVIGKLSYFAEFFSSVSVENPAGWVGTVDTWLTYEVNKGLRVDGGLYIGVTKAADDWHPWLGMTWRH